MKENKWSWELINLGDTNKHSQLALLSQIMLRNALTDTPEMAPQEMSSPLVLSWGHLAMSADILTCATRSVGADVCYWHLQRTEMLLNILQCSSQSSTLRNHSAHYVHSAWPSLLLTSSCKWLCPIYFCWDRLLRLWQRGTLPVLCNGCLFCRLIFPLL